MEVTCFRIQIWHCYVLLAVNISWYLIICKLALRYVPILSGIFCTGVSMASQLTNLNAARCTCLPIHLYTLCKGMRKTEFSLLVVNYSNTNYPSMKCCLSVRETHTNNAKLKTKKTTGMRTFHTSKVYYDITKYQNSKFICRFMPKIFSTIAVYYNCFHMHMKYVVL